MPITIKSTELKYKNPSTGQYQGIDAVAERTTSEQCALIEAKGAETIASIPSDYTTLSNTVSDLNGAITSLGSDDIANDSTNVSGSKVTDALDTLNGAITNGTLLDGMPQTGKQIPANSNLNDYTTAGTYWVQSDSDAATIANMPRAASGTLYVINRATGSYKTQIYYPTSSVILCYVRNYNAGSWTDWDYRAMISEVKNDIALISSNVTERCYKINSSENGVTFNWRGDGAVIVNGTASATAFNYIYYSPQSMPCGMKAGETYKAAAYTTNKNCYFQVDAYVNGAWQEVIATSSSSITPFTVPVNATGVFLRIGATGGYSYSAAIVKPILYSEKTSTDWQLMGVGAEAIPSGANLNDYSMPGTYTVTSDAIAQTITNIPRGASGILYVINRGDTISYQMQVYIPSTSYQILYTRIKNNGTWGSWTVRGETIVITGTRTTSGSGTVDFDSDTSKWLTSQYACFSVIPTGNVTSMLLIPYKFGDAVGGRWGFKACNSSDFSPRGNEAISFAAILYRYN